MMAMLRSTLHMAVMFVTVIPYTLLILLARLLGAKGNVRYGFAQKWLTLSIDAARVIMGIRYQVQGQENLPVGETSPAILLVKHQSTYETFLMPAIMPHPLAYVFKKELLYVPFFGWSIGSLDMIHIDRSQRAQAFNKVVAQGRELLARGIWVIMFPEGTRIPRGEQGQYKSGGTRLAIETGAPVIPIAVTSAKCWPRKAFIKTAGWVDVSIGAPIPSEGREPEEMMAQVQAWIESEMRRLDPDAYL
jgi:1-acyl-sn-glycerol-3-phosphate acyltransferase